MPLLYIIIIIITRRIREIEKDCDIERTIKNSTQTIRCHLLLGVGEGGGEAMQRVALPHHVRKSPPSVFPPTRLIVGARNCVRN